MKGIDAMRRLGSLVGAFMLLASLTIGMIPSHADALGSQGTGGYPYWDAVSKGSGNYWVDENNNGIVDVGDPANGKDEYRSGTLNYYRNCTDYVAWKIGTYGVNVGYSNGHCGKWGVNNPAKIATVPKPGMAASRNVGSIGHVMFIDEVHSDGTITVSEYNKGNAGNYGTRTGTKAGLGITDYIDFGVDPSLVTTVASNSTDTDGDAGETGINLLDPSVVIRNSNDGNLAIWKISSTGNGANGGQQYPLSAGWTVAASTDIDEDGDIDLILRNKAAGQVAVWKFDGVTRNDPRPAFNLGSNWDITSYLK